MKKRKIIGVIVIVVAIGVCVYIGYAVYLFNNTQIEMYSKTHVKLEVEESDVIDYNIFLNPPQGKTEALKQINEDTRAEIADYMKNNDFKLKQGVYYIPKQSITNGEEQATSYDEYMELFQFEKI